MRRVVAIGGGGFLMEDAPSPIDHFLLQLTDKPCPRVCFIPTGSGDSEEHLAKFYAAYDEKSCSPSHLAFFRNPRPNALKIADYRRELLAQDLVFIGGGNTKSALAVWREWGLDAVLKDAWVGGVILSGMSAGALCWFEVGVTDSWNDGSYRPLPCLGLLPGACAAHYNGSPSRREMLHAAVRSRTVPDAVAIDDGAAVVFADGKLARVVTWQDDAGAYRVRFTNGSVVEEAYESERITVLAN